MSVECNKTGFATRAVHAGAAPDPATGARTTPIYLTNGFVFDDPEEAADIFALRKIGFSYSRGSNPTTAALERRVTDLEGGTLSVAIGSGQAALLVILLTLMESGDEYVAASRLFGGSLGLMRRLEQRHGLKVHFADPTDPASIAAAVTGKTKAIVVESIVNPCGSVVDLQAISAIARRHKVPLIVDNTLASPYLIRPFEHGADIVFHSTSKFLGGHGQVIGGIIVDGGSFDWAGDARYPLISAPWGDYEGIVLAEAFPKNAFAVAARLYGLRDLGPGISPATAFLTLTGIETLPLRMARHCANAKAVAQHLATHPAVAEVSYPSIEGHPGKAIADRYSPEGAGSVFTVALKGGDQAATRFIAALKLFSHIANIGETRSLAIHPATTTHRNMPPQERAKAGVGGNVVRLSIGLEDAADIIADLDQALAAAS
ncbi:MULTISPECIES: O-acetylhomoserine aminocarboxypropyltransferase/cysteine synthase family protein [unclassified Chelatococcus]|uniref:O-acetylhomoserine aminocarboxypropyltransferase/cysteine synthase family protein n=1 Tax=unclassified Chelatococcus TaxID=2638111 RepID=UPI0003143BBF|nr:MULTISPECIES: aminotransferase class I/II-fold pyridoxal phosphate-dependent enzyme [unclassified Chelatococcus]ALA18759.1 O-acetylhomoserine aminocarboxypropyltransferase [Chelatococcus sp. CO-6]